MAEFLNRIVIDGATHLHNAFPHSPETDRPLPEDYVRRSLPYGWNYLTPAYLDKAGIDQDEHGIEAPSMGILRKQRILYLGRKIATVRSTLYLNRNH